MATITGNRNLRTLVAAGTSNGAGSTTNGSQNLSATIGPHLLTSKITNGGTGPTVACTMTAQVSGDNTNWKLFAAFTATTSNGAVAEFPVEIPAGTMFLRVQFSGNTGQAVTVEAFLQELTSFTAI